MRMVNEDGIIRTVYNEQDHSPEEHSDKDNTKTKRLHHGNNKGKSIAVLQNRIHKLDLTQTDDLQSLDDGQ